MCWYIVWLLSMSIMMSAPERTHAWRLKIPLSIKNQNLLIKVELIKLSQVHFQFTAKPSPRWTKNMSESIYLIPLWKRAGECLFQPCKSKECSSPPLGLGPKVTKPHIGRRTRGGNLSASLRTIFQLLVARRRPTRARRTPKVEIRSVLEM